jgi:hypothetical protein
MSHDNRKICPLCAWRANCAKRFSRGDDASLHCPDFSEDVTLRKLRRADEQDQQSHDEV